MTRHAVVFTLGAGAYLACTQHWPLYKHQCIPDLDWPGSNSQYRFAQSWYEATTLSKLEIILNTVSLGYSLIWADTDVIHFADAFPYFAALQADVALSAENCESTGNFTAGAPPALNQNTGIGFYGAHPKTLRLVYDWLSLQRAHLREWGPEQYDPEDSMQRRSDQITFNHHLGPQLLQAAPAGQDLYVRIVSLPQTHFPNWCMGECGCHDKARAGPKRIEWELDESNVTVRGTIECSPSATLSWLMFHVPCADSSENKLVILDMYQRLASSKYVLQQRLRWVGLGLYEVPHVRL